MWGKDIQKQMDAPNLLWSDIYNLTRFDVPALDFVKFHNNSKDLTHVDHVVSLTHLNADEENSAWFGNSNSDNVKTVSIDECPDFKYTENESEKSRKHFSKVSQVNECHDILYQSHQCIRGKTLDYPTVFAEILDRAQNSTSIYI
eukprot:UN28995